MLPLNLPAADGGLESYLPGPATHFERPDRQPTKRVAYAAAHVVANPLADTHPEGPPVVDWTATLAFRHHLWEHRLGVAEAMDTAQRGMGLDWAVTRELIERSGREAAAVGGSIVSGVGTDQLPSDQEVGLAEIIAAYEEQLEVVESAGSRAVLMASRHLAATAVSAENYHEVYGHLLEQITEPVIIHWLGEMFDPALSGYWGQSDPAAAVDVVAALCADHRNRIDGVKVSLLDPQLEVELRNRLPDGLRCYTGDDFHYPELIKGDDRGHSDALLGVFDAIAPAAAAALAALDAGNAAAYEDILAPTVPLARQLFASPTYYYKTGIVFLAWLCGHQNHFRMVAGLESARSVPHLAELFRLADRAGLLVDPERARNRFAELLRVAGIEQPT